MSKIEENNLEQDKFIREEPPIIYYYDPFTKEFIKEGHPDPDQTDINNWLYPAFTTLITVIDPKEGYARIFDEDKQVWDYIENHRNEIWYNKENGQKIVIGYLGKVDETIYQKDKPVFKEVEKLMPSLTPRQIRRALLSIGKLDIVDNVIESMKSPEKEAAKIDWEYANIFIWDNPLIQALIPNLGLSENEIKTKWLEASKLED